jgi:hypothetical protein
MNTIARLATPARRRLASALFWGAAGIAVAALLFAYVDALDAAVRRGEDLRRAQQRMQQSLATNEREVAHARAF